MIGLMDCNNFFVSCERLFRPDLLGKPVAVLSSNDGCIVARSQEVKDLGVPMGVPLFEVKDIFKAHNIVIFSSNLTLYRDISARVIRALTEEFDTCEVYSVDEAFFEVPEGISAAALADVRARVMQKTGIPVSIGVAETKTLAKVANNMAKKRKDAEVPGVCILSEAEWKKIQTELPCGSIWGIGRQTTKFLNEHKIFTVAELLNQDPAFIKNKLGVVGERLVLELKGISVYRMGEGMDEEQQSYTSTRSFGKPINNKLTLMSALGHHVSHVAEKLRSDGMTASRMTIVARASRYSDAPYRKGSNSIDLLLPTNDTQFLIKEASRLLDRLYDAEIPYKKAGVILSGIQPQEYTAESLFKDEKREQNKVLNALSDVLNEKFGSNTIRSGVMIDTQSWKSKKEKQSGEYTTKWSQIARVKAK